MAKILMMAGSTVVVLSLLGFLVLLLKGRAVTKTSPVLMSLKALCIRPSEAEQRLCRQRVWVGNDTLMTPREQHFFRALLRHTSRKRWLLCPQVRVADIATLSPHIRPRSRTWWQLFRMASQWHCDVVIVDIHTFAIIGAVELDDASHQKTPYPARYSAGRGSEAGRYSTTTRSGFREAGKKGRRVSEIPRSRCSRKIHNRYEFNGRAY